MTFEKWPAGEQARQANLRLAQLVAGQLPAHVPQDITAYGAAGCQRGGEAREQLLEDLPAAWVQTVQMPTVRHAPAVLPGGWQHVPLDDHYPFEPLRQHAGREQTRDAGPENDGLVTVRVSHVLAPSGQAAGLMTA